MDIKTASDVFGVDRLLMIGLIQFLATKKIISNKNDIENLEKICQITVENMKKTKDPIAIIQLEKTEIELKHIFQSFRID
ncbi:MAG: hypothetical protein LGL72_12885 [Acidibrevibacterium sp.]|jgi:Xaa-Pro aminopeptidase|uniref:hypothetical protein n=1 Tax=Acidibrevibacterium fodinaquatile TaxID=1969806 RepID=UPI0023A79B78|nr:hypothetical protein [Acidibrevibacterium fodinaquatile]MCA7120275.1 hypothetical protein [Acidibrevibacterium fodinaquatile]